MGADGAAYLEVHSETRVWNYEPCGNGSGAEHLSVELLRIDWNGDVSSQVLQSVDRALAMDVPHYELVVGQVLPDEGGGVLATWFVNRSDAESQHAAAYVQGSAVTTYALPAGAGVAMVGADGVGLLSSSDGLAAFDLASGGVRWSVAIWGQPVAALADGGAAVLATDGTLYTVGGTGQADAGTAMLGGIFPLHYWGVGTWLAYDAATLTGLAGPEIDEALVSFNPDGGNPQKQLGLSRPTIATFLPLPLLQNPPVDEIARSARVEFYLSLNSGPVTIHTSRESSATVGRFLGAISSSAVVAFIGDSVVIRNDPPGGPPFSAGLHFFDKYLIKYREPIDGPQWVPTGQAPENIRREYRLATQAKVVFIASCYIGPEFTDLWGITETTPGRMLIVPVNEDAQTDLLLGAKVWLSIAGSLSHGLTVGEALRDANEGLPMSQQWHRIGGTDGYQLVKRPPQ